MVDGSYGQSNRKRISSLFGTDLPRLEWTINGSSLGLDAIAGNGRINRHKDESRGICEMSGDPLLTANDRRYRPIKEVDIRIFRP